MIKSIHNLSHIGITDEIPENEKRYIILINIIAAFLIAFSWLYAPLIYIYLPDSTELLAVILCHGLFFILIPVLNHFHKYLASRILFGISSAFFLVLESLLSGPEAYTHFFFLVAPIVPLFIYPERQRVYKYLMVFLFTGCFIFLNYWFMDHEPIRNITDPEVLIFAQWSIKIGIAFSLITISVYAHHIVSVTERLLLQEHQKAENLLRNILPDKIADRLKGSSHSIADGFEYVSILFADLVGFTELSGKTEPDRLVRLLNDIFSKFDDLVDRYGLEKIKTIGDAYMIASGIPEPKENHAELLLQCARGMITELDLFNSQNDTELSIRIGINTGSVVAGVIGKKKFIYDLWGDSVNIASRMESHGIAGRIQVAESTYMLLRDKYSFEKRGEIEIKGKGKMTTYLYNQ